jgi:hypothetical protein
MAAECDRAFVDGSNIDDALNRKREAGGEGLLPVFGVGGEAEFLQVEVLAVEIFLGVTVTEEIRGFAQRSRKSTYLSNQFTHTYNDGIYELVAVFSQPPGTEFQGSTGLVSRQFELPSP